jgi:hypothetical protein
VGSWFRIWNKCFPFIKSFFIECEWKGAWTCWTTTNMVIVREI